MDTNTRARAEAEELRRASKYCNECGRSDLVVAFRSELSRRCDDCHEKSRREHQAFQRTYSKARYAATQRVLQAHAEEFQAVMDEELDRRRGPDGSLLLDLQEEEAYEQAS